MPSQHLVHHLSFIISISGSLLRLGLIAVLHRSSAKMWEGRRNLISINDVSRQLGMAEAGSQLLAYFNTLGHKRGRPRRGTSHQPLSSSQNGLHSLFMR